MLFKKLFGYIVLNIVAVKDESFCVPQTVSCAVVTKIICLLKILQNINSHE